MGYTTRQSKEILECLKNNKGRHLTADDVYSILSSNGVSVGRTTVYRHIEKLYSDGIIRRFTIGDSTSTCYQFADDSAECHNHYHLKCTECGALLHAECEFLNELSEHIFKEHSFKINGERTVLYGICEACRKKGKI